MQHFLAANPGLESRFDRMIHFRDFTTDELVEIFRLRAADSDYDLAPGFLGARRSINVDTHLRG
jgi:hypothetical protein